MRQSSISSLIVLTLFSTHGLAQYTVRQAPASQNQMQSTTAVQSSATTAQNSQANFLQQLSQQTGCYPQNGQPCYYQAITTMQMLQFFQYCTFLNNWIVTYNPPSEANIRVSMTSGGNVCNVTIYNGNKNPPETKNCNFTASEIQNLRSSSTAQAYLSNYDQNQQTMSEEALQAISSTLFSCIKGKVNPMFRESQAP